jgi:hypothetical protein
LKCISCGETFEFDDVVEKSYSSHDDLNNGGGFAYCNNCKYTELPSVMKLENKWICFFCNEIYNDAGNCEYCDESIAGDLEDTFLSSCLMCEGQMSHYMNSSTYD